MSCYTIGNFPSLNSVVISRNNTYNIQLVFRVNVGDSSLLSLVKNLLLVLRFASYDGLEPWLLRSDCLRGL